jgi:hypothetical protein
MTLSHQFAVEQVRRQIDNTSDVQALRELARKALGLAETQRELLIQLLQRGLRG